jgi:hypothetical protein
MLVKNSYKITDGDLVIVHLKGSNISSATMEKYREKLIKWASKRGLSNVEILISSGEIDLQVTQISANDVFEKEVLGDNNG